MARPRKPDAEKLVPVWAHLPPNVVAAIKRCAESRRTHVSVVVRKLVLLGLKQSKTQTVDTSLTL